MDSNIKQINKCKKISKDFWYCIDNHKYMKNVTLNCGREFFILSECMKKIK